LHIWQVSSGRRAWRRKKGVSIERHSGQENAMIMNLETLNVALADGVVTVELNRPDKANAMSAQMWVDIGTAFRAVDETPEAWRSSAVAARISRPASTSAAGRLEESGWRRLRRPHARLPKDRTAGCAQHD
jgi:hypothetical protein